MTGVAAPDGPKVAVIIPAYNAAATIDRAIASVERQTYPNWEIVVADDASTDNTAELAARHSKTKVVSLLCNSGAAAARDLGVQNAEADLIAMLDADDASHQERLEIQAHILTALEHQHGRPVLLYTGRVCIGPKGRRWLHRGRRAMSGEVWYTSLAEVLTGRHYLMGATVMMRRQTWLDLGGQAHSDVDEELDIYARAANRGCLIAHIGLPLYYQHITPNSRQHYVRDRAMRFERILQLWDPGNAGRVADRRIEDALHRAMCCFIYRQFTHLFIKKGFYAQARELAAKAAVYGPLPAGLRAALLAPSLYRFLDAHKRQLAEALYAWRSRGALRVLDTGTLPLAALIAKTSLRLPLPPGSTGST